MNYPISYRMTSAGKTIATAMMMALATISCNKSVMYQTNHQPAGNKSASVITDAPLPKTLRPDDRITVSIWNHNDFSVGTIYDHSEETGKHDKWVMVNDRGEVNLPKVGRVKVIGLTIGEATRKLEKVYSKYITNPIINIQLLSNRITVLGEVKNPGTYNLTSDSYRLVDIIGRCSGFSDYARISDIKIIRGNQSFKADLSNTAYNETMVYPDDVIYVPPVGRKNLEKNAEKAIAVTGVITAIVMLFLFTNY